LFSLTENSVKFVWTEKYGEAFKELKERLIISPILSYPDSQGRFILDTDASNHRIGAVLSQKQGGTEKVIAYFSRVLNKLLCNPKGTTRNSRIFEIFPSLFIWE